MPNKQTRRYLGHNFPTDICPACGVEAFIIDHRFACCGARSSLDIEPWELPRANQPKWVPLWARSNRRGQTYFRRMIQAKHCTYCRRKFGSLVYHGYRRIRLEMELDHIVPWSKTKNDDRSNLTPACHVCNRLKWNKVMGNIEHIRAYLKQAWKDYGYSD